LFFLSSIDIQSFTKTTFAKYSSLHSCLYFETKNSVRVVFKNTVITAPLNKAIWAVWDPGNERISNVFLAEYNSSGSEVGGVGGTTRASFATVLGASRAAAYSISTAVGSDYASWVDSAYLV
jgi:pectinesterase